MATRSAPSTAAWSPRHSRRPAISHGSLGRMTNDAVTYTATSYTMTVADTVTPNGQHGVRLTCSCGTHAGNSGAAILATPTSAADFPESRIHGHVTMAHDPFAGRAAERQGKLWRA
jgi:hypothetical protein